MYSLSVTPRPSSEWTQRDETPVKSPDLTDRILSIISGLPPSQQNIEILKNLKEQLSARGEELKKKISLGKAAEHDRTDLVKLLMLIETIQQQLVQQTPPSSPSKFEAVVDLLFPRNL